MRAVNSIASNGSMVFAGTSGGVFTLDRETGDVSTYTIVEGLHSVVINTVAVAASANSLWIGYSDGVLDRLDVETGEVDSFRDIERATQFSSRQINRIVVRGDSLLVATAFGVVVFDGNRGEVRDSYTRLGSFNPGIDVRDVSIVDGPFGETIWVATSEGVAYAPFGETNLQDPSVWSNDVIGSDGALSIASFSGSVLTGTDSGLFERQEDSTYIRVGSSTERIESLTTADDKLLAAGEFRVYVLDSAGFRALASDVTPAPTGIVSDIDGTIWVGDLTAGVVQVGAVLPTTTELPVVDATFPDGPIDGLFIDVSVAPDGSLVTGGVPGGGRGFYTRSADGIWTSYVPSLTPDIGDRASFAFVEIDQAGTVWAGSVGGGVVSVLPDGTATNYRMENSSLLPVSSTTDFIIVGGLDSDASNTLWVTTYGSSRPLHARDPSGTWTGLPPYIGQGLTSTSTAYGKITIDSFGQKWIIVRDESSFSNTRGLMVVDTKSTPIDQSDDSFRFFGSSGGGGQGLPSNIVTSVAADRDGLMWIGTEEGLAYFVNTGIIADDANSIAIWPQRADRSEGVFLLFGLRVNALAVDPANRIWVGSDEGIRIIESVEGGFAEVLTLSTDNAPLPSNRVIDIDVHPASGEVYIVTDAGMVSTRGEAIEPAKSAQDLFVYPNPLDLGAGDSEGVYIEGLVEGTIVTIIDPSGTVIRRIDARGGRVKWDGRDGTGQLARSGIYIVVAVGQEGEGVAFGKVAVIR